MNFLKKKALINLSLMLLLLTIIPYSNSYASIFAGHWSENYVEYDFYNNYFENHIQKLQTEYILNAEITKEDFLRIFTEIAEEKVDITLENDELSKPLPRKTAVTWLINAIEYEKMIDMTDIEENRFIDLEGLENKEKENIFKARSIGLVNGYSETIFAPNDNVTYAQAIVLLQRLRKNPYLIEDLIPFKVIDTITEHTQQREGLFITEKEEKIIVTIVRRFNTSGYGLEVANIVKLDDSKYGINTNVIRPNPKHMVLQVISFVRTTIEIDKDYLESDYTFEILRDPVEITTFQDK